MWKRSTRHDRRERLRARVADARPIESLVTALIRSHVILPKELAKLIPKAKLLGETEWRSFGVQQSRGWEHYAIHRPEPHILLFRRPLGTDPVTGKVRAPCVHA